jgi:hypothetical protein
MKGEKTMIKITKTRLLDKGFNDMEGYHWHYLYYFRLYSKNKKKYYRYAFVINFNGEDFDEFRYDEEEDIYYKYTPKEYADELASSFIYSYNFSYEKHDEFFDACKNTIEAYNKRIAPNYDTSTIWGMACDLTRKTFGIKDERLNVNKANLKV